MQGVIQQVSVSRGGVPKRAIEGAVLTRERVEGDDWAHPQYHGGPQQAVLLIAEEVLEDLKQQGYPVFNGALGENLTTRGLNPHEWRKGQIFRVGAARIELTKPRSPCSTIEVYGPTIRSAIYDAKVKAKDPSSPVWGYSGFYAAVITEGFVRAGDSIELESQMV